MKNYVWVRISKGYRPRTEEILQICGFKIEIKKEIHRQKKYITVSLMGLDSTHGKKWIAIDSDCIDSGWHGWKEEMWEDPLSTPNVLERVSELRERENKIWEMIKAGTHYIDLADEASIYEDDN